MLRGPRAGVAFGLTMLLTCVAIGTIGFRQIEGWGLFDSFYMTIISITTVGYNELSHLRGHHIVCGWGRTGKVVADELEADGYPFCIVEADKEAEQELQESGYLYVIGDATDETVLNEAGVGQAATIMSLLSSDADNLYLSIMAKEINPEVVIVARALDDLTQWQQQVD